MRFEPDATQSGSKFRYLRLSSVLQIALFFRLHGTSNSRSPHERSHMLKTPKQNFASHAPHFTFTIK